MSHYDSRGDGDPSSPYRGRAPWYLPGASVRGPIYFYDGTWVDEADPAAVKYEVNNTTRHGTPGVKQDWSGGSGAATKREVYLRLPRPVLLLAERPVTFCFFFEKVYADAGVCGNQDQIDVDLGLVTDDLSQSILEAMTWNTKVASDDGRIVGTLLVDPATDDWWRNTPDDVAGRCSALCVRVTPTATLTLTGVRLWIPIQDEYTDAVGDATLMNTRVGQPHRSFLIREKKP